ncbi:hypothetical protein ACHAXA_008250 [Cyclostephanos tholiformis]|uniref:Uncharacterized protein n=1 Tax=Cyclostephanos tholiformis TaxID=382380 RepID=A0ABD3RAS3_9STRA
MSQSSNTPRRLLLKLRVKAWEDAVFRSSSTAIVGNDDDDRQGGRWSDGFAVWGAGRNGKDFLKALSPDVLSKVVCLVDVDQRKIESIRWYDNPSLLGRGNRIPILHFSDLTRDGNVGTGDVKFGRIDKRKCEEGDFVVASSHQRARLNEVRTKGRNFDTERQSDVDREVLRRLPVVICMAMFQTNGALESNVASIGRVEGKSLWHII